MTVLATPTIVATGVPNAGQATFSGGPSVKVALPWNLQFSDQSIRGAAKINPAYAADMYAGNYIDQNPRNTAINAPLETKSKFAAEVNATVQGPNAWKKQTLPSWSDSVRFGVNKPQKPFAKPWNKAFIPPLALFNDASQWVNRLLLNRPMTPWGGGDSDPPLRAQYFTPPPIMTNNLAAGTMNAQLQLGQIAIQAQNLTLSASNYFGGS